MPTITAEELQTIMGLSDTDLPHLNAEGLIDAIIDTLNLFGAELSNLGGATPNKTLTVTSKERGAIIQGCRAAYYSFYKNLDATAISSLSVTGPDIMSNPTVLEVIKQAATRLQMHQGIPFCIGEDTSGIDDT